VNTCFLHLQGLSLSTVWIWVVMPTFRRWLLPPNTAHIRGVQSAKSEVSINSLYIYNVQFNFVTIIGDKASSSLHIDVLIEIKALYNMNYIIPISFPVENTRKIKSTLRRDADNGVTSPNIYKYTSVISLSSLQEVTRQFCDRYTFIRNYCTPCDQNRICGF
jgi:hypothetical protein